MADVEDPSKNYDQEFFLALAGKGKNAWNAWRRDPANKDVRVTFAHVDFSEAPSDQTDFSGFEFGMGADFSGCKWRGVGWKEIQKDTKAFRPGRACFTGVFFGDRAKFVGALFGDLAEFSHANFGNDTNFTNATFGDAAGIIGTSFGSSANFTLATFGYGAAFAGTTFGLEASFTGATFDPWASFRCAAFGQSANFADATFGDWANFRCASLGFKARLTSATFGSFADFTGVAFSYLADFRQTHFKGLAEFTGRSEQQWAGDLATIDEMDEKARAALETRHKNSWDPNGGPDHFLAISFANARFEDEADFSRRTFEWEADFTGAHFYYPPNFDGVTNAGRIDFTGTKIGFAPSDKLFHWTSKTQVPVRLRAFRKVAEETKNHDLARDLYIEERKAERGVYWRQLSGLDELETELKDITEQEYHVWLEWRLKRRARNARWLRLLAKPAQLTRLIAHCLWILVMWFYWALANYGRNPALPLGWLIASWYGFYRLYLSILSPIMAKACQLDDVDQYRQAVGMVALGNAVPFIGPLTIDGEIKKFLSCAGDANCLPIPPEGFQLLVIAQNILSIILVFFIGLALRNYFRIK